jgi:pimeloyl-ACP methyl ester carboxylesterase
VCLHGGGQNAHKWDAVALLLDRPLIALDLAGHGWSDDSRERMIDFRRNSLDVAFVIETLVPDLRGVVGMSLGAMTTLALVDQAPAVVWLTPRRRRAGPGQRRGSGRHACRPARRRPAVFIAADPSGDRPSRAETGKP